MNSKTRSMTADELSRRPIRRRLIRRLGRIRITHIRLPATLPGDRNAALYIARHARNEA